MMQPKRETGARSYKTIIISACAGVALAFIWVGIRFSMPGSSAPISVLAGNTCYGMAQDEYTVAKMVNGWGGIDLIVYCYTGKDETSAALVQASVKGSSPMELFHKFYAEELCDYTHNCTGIAIDAGAFLGTHALYLAKLGLQVHAFEPLTTSYNLLRCSAEANTFTGTGSVTVLKEGLSEKAGTDCLYPPPATTMDAARVMKNMVDCSSKPSHQINVVTLDHYWTDVLDKQQVDFIKLDIEAHENSALKGGKQLFTTKPPPMVLMEYYPSLMAIYNETTEAVLDTVFSYGYRVYDCTKSRELTEGTDVKSVLSTYLERNQRTDLLLLHSTVFKEKELKQFKCGGF